MLLLGGGKVSIKSLKRMSILFSVSFEREFFISDYAGVKRESLRGMEGNVITS